MNNEEHLPWRHLILYARGHYRSAGLLLDLRAVIAREKEVAPDSVSIADIHRVVSGLFVQHVPPEQRRAFSERLLLLDSPVDMEQSVEAMLSMIGSHQRMQQGGALPLGDPDPCILPLTLAAAA